MSSKDLVSLHAGSLWSPVHEQQSCKSKLQSREVVTCYFMARSLVHETPKECLLAGSDLVYPEISKIYAKTSVLPLPGSLGMLFTIEGLRATSS